MKSEPTIVTSNSSTDYKHAAIRRIQASENQAAAPETFNIARPTHKWDEFAGLNSSNRLAKSNSVSRKYSILVRQDSPVVVSRKDSTDSTDSTSEDNSPVLDTPRPRK